MAFKTDIEIAREAKKRPIQEIGAKIGIPTEGHRVGSSGLENPVLSFTSIRIFFSDADDVKPILQPQIGDHSASNIQLSLAAVDDQQIRIRRCGLITGKPPPADSSSQKAVVP